MEKKREWQRTTQLSVNTGARIPHWLYNRMVEHMQLTGQSKTEVICAALRKYLEDQEKGASEV